MQRSTYGWVAALAAAALLAVATASGGAQTASADAVPGKSADEVVRELANPNNSLASLAFKNQFRRYTGSFPGASDQDNYGLLFQPVLPFPLNPSESGGKASLFVRPAILLLFNQPVRRVKNGQPGFDDVTALGDIGFDTGCGVTEKTGLLWAFGMVGTLPTATNSEVAGKQLWLGPEALFAKFENWGLHGIFPSHQWSVAGWSDKSYSTSQVSCKTIKGGSMTLNSHFETMPIDGLIVVQGGDVLYERYRTLRPDDKPMWFSVSKISGSTMFAFLEHEGKGDVERKGPECLPELPGSMWNAVRVVEALDMATGLDGTDHDDLGVVTEGAYADLILVVGNPLRNLDLVANPDKNFVVTMKDGEIYKDTIE